MEHLLDNFYCPIHSTNECIKREINTHIDSWDNFQCPKCFELENSTEKLSSWFFDSQKKIPPVLKERIKLAPIEFFNIDDDGRQSYTCYRYVNSQITKIHLYHYGISFKKREEYTNVRCSVQTQKKIRYKDLEKNHNIPIDLVRDQSFICSILNP
jgi:hypothetical protein